MPCRIFYEEFKLGSRSRFDLAEADRRLDDATKSLFSWVDQLVRGLPLHNRGYG